MKRTAFNFLSIVGSDIARRLVGFIAVAYLARKVGSAGFGAINIGFAVLSYALLVSSAGLHTFGVRAVARGEHGASLVRTVVSIRLVGGLAAFVLVVGISYFISNTDTARLIVLFSVSLFANAFLLDWYFQGKERMGIVGGARLVQAGVYLLVVLLFVRTPADVLWVAAASIAGDVVAAAITFVMFRRERSDENDKVLGFSLANWKSTIDQAFPIGVGSIFAQVGVNLPTIVIGIVMMNSDVGEYNAASKLVFFLLMLDRVLGSLLLPASSRLHSSSPQLLASTLNTAIKWIFLTALPICIGGTLLASRIVPLVYGAGYAPAIDVFRILVWYFLVTTIHTVFTAGLIAVGEEKSYSRLMIISAVFYTVAVILCTVMFGTPGAAAAVVVSEVATLVLMRQQLRPHIEVHVPNGAIGALASVVVMGVVVLMLTSLHVLAAIVVGALVYAAVLLATRALTFSEISSMLRRI